MNPDEFEIKFEPPEKGAVLRMHLGECWSGDPACYLDGPVIKVKGDSIVNNTGYMPNFVRFSKWLANNPPAKLSKYRITEYELKYNALGKGLHFEHNELDSKKSRDKLVHTISDYADRVDPVAWPEVKNYNALLKKTYERSRRAYRNMDFDKFETLMKKGLQPNEDYFKEKKGGVIYCSASRTKAAQFKDYPIMVQFRDVNKVGRAVEYTPLFGLKANGTNMIETAYYGAIHYIDEHEVRLPANSEAKNEVVYIDKSLAPEEELIKYVREHGWDGKIVTLDKEKRNYIKYQKQPKAWH